MPSYGSEGQGFESLGAAINEIVYAISFFCVGGVSLPLFSIFSAVLNCLILRNPPQILPYGIKFLQLVSFCGNYGIIIVRTIEKRFYHEICMRRLRMGL